jgi:hypothetical protein
MQTHIFVYIFRMQEILTGFTYGGRTEGILYKQKKTPWPLVRKRNIPTDDRHLLAKFSANF